MLDIANNIFSQRQYIIVNLHKQWMCIISLKEYSIPIVSLEGFSIESDYEIADLHEFRFFLITSFVVQIMISINSNPHLRCQRQLDYGIE